MTLECIGPSLYSASGTVFAPRVATVLPDTQTLITKGTTHWGQREVYCDHLEANRLGPPTESLTPSQRLRIWQTGVDLIVQPDLVLIRPDPDQIDRVLRADELLQETVNKRRIRFLLASHAKIFMALMKRGELWRIASDAVTSEEMKSRIRSARMKLDGRVIYY